MTRIGCRRGRRGRPRRERTPKSPRKSWKSRTFAERWANSSLPDVKERQFKD